MQLGEIEATIVNPTDDISVVRFERAGRVVETVGTGVEPEAVLAAVGSFLSTTAPSEG